MESIPYKDRKGCYIVVKEIKEPYGPGTSPVISIGSTLKGDVDNPTWKVHVPVDLVDNLVKALREYSDGQ